MRGDVGFTIMLHQQPQSQIPSQASVLQANSNVDADFSDGDSMIGD